MKSEVEFKMMDESGNNRPPSLLVHRETGPSLQKNIIENKDHCIEDMEKFEPVIEHFCFENQIPLKEIVESFERAVLIKVLSRFNGNQRRAAKYLRVKSSTLNEKIKKHNIHFKKEAY